MYYGYNRDGSFFDADHLMGCVAVEIVRRHPLIDYITDGCKVVWQRKPL